MNSQNLWSIDAWMREADESLKSVEDIEGRVNNNEIDSPDQHHNWVRNAARFKLNEVGVKLDRLESLLHNPPSKPLLTGEDVEYRWKMLRDVQMRTRALAVRLYSLPDSKKSWDLTASQNKTGSASINDCHHRQDEIKSTIPKNGGDKELLLPLTSDDLTERRLQAKDHTTFSLRSLLNKILWIFCLILGSAVLLLLLVVICAVI